MRGVKLVFVLVALAVAFLVIWRQLSKPVMSIEEIQRNTAKLLSQELRFLSRGHDFAHYELTLLGTSADTVRGYYRVPANTRKLPALVWVYDAQSQTDAKSLLDGIPESSQCAVICLNAYSLFSPKKDGALKNDHETLTNGLLSGKHAVELCAQFLKRHHVVDSNLVYAGGEGIGLLSELAAASGSSGKIRGFIFTEPDDAALSELLSECDDLSPKAWSGRIAPTAAALVTTGPTSFKEQLPRSWSCETLYMKADAAGEGARIKAALQAGLTWILTSNPVNLDLPGLTDSTKVISVKK